MVHGANSERRRACRRMHKSEGAHPGSPWSEHPMARVDGVGGLGHRALVEEELESKEGRQRVMGDRGLRGSRAR
jgi:hypothetical protein